MDKYTRIIDDAMKNPKHDALHNFLIGTRNMMDEMLKDAPVFMRINFILNAMKDLEPSAADWKRMNEVLTRNPRPYDYNCFGEVKSREDIVNIHLNLNTASIMNLAWRKDVCKDCGQEFYMQKSEVDFFQNKELSLPKRCKECRDKRKVAVANA